MRRLRVITEPFGQVSTLPAPRPSEDASGARNTAQDANGRRLRYVRLSLTDRCDLRCTYCMPAEGIAASPRSTLLSFEDIVRLAGIFRSMGVRTLRLTGGEPLLRKNIAELIRRLRIEAGIEDLALTTNASALKPLAADLARAGLRRINVSLDSLKPDTFRRLTRGGDLHRVLAGIDAATEAGITEVKLNTVVIRGENDCELPDIVQYAWEKNYTPRFIELMPLGEGAKLGPTRVVPVKEMLQRMTALVDTRGEHSTYHPHRGPARYFARHEHPTQRVGFIGAMSDNFCERCNRVRISAQGQIRACLASPEGLNLKTLLAQKSDDEVARRIQETLGAKGHGHHFYRNDVQTHHAVHMSGIGG